VAGKKLNRSSGHRRALRRNLITELFRHERIETTEAKAKAVRPHAEKLITLAKRGDPERLIELAESGDREALAALVRRKNAERLLALTEAGDSEGAEAFARALALHARRQVMRTITDKAIVDRLIHEIAPQYLDRPGGYTRIVKLGPRLGDNAPMVFLELVE